MNRYMFRLNKQPAPVAYMWRIWENGKELDRYASRLKIDVPSWTDMVVEDYPDFLGRFEKYNMVCEGYLHWDEQDSTVAMFKPYPPGEKGLDWQCFSNG